jgi:hypothetical protein
MADGGSSCPFTTNTEPGVGDGGESQEVLDSLIRAFAALPQVGVGGVVYECAHCRSLLINRPPLSPAMRMWQTRGACWPAVESEGCNSTATDVNSSSNPTPNAVPLRVV